MTVKKNDWVSVEYTGQITETKEIFDTNKERGPLKFKVGAGMVIPGFDAALIDMQEGQEKEINIPLEKAYGPRNTQEVELPKASFQDVDTLEQGKEFVVNTNFGPMMIEVKEIKEQAVRAILNHPLAGKDLTFKIKLTKILNEEEAKEIEEQFKKQAEQAQKTQPSCGADCSSCQEHDSCSESEDSE
jgi:peptidylprolyl isomerase